MILAPEDSSLGTLRIPAAQERDAGVYTCRAVNEVGDASTEVRLEVGRECAPVPTCPAPLALPLREFHQVANQCGVCVMCVPSTWGQGRCLSPCHKLSPNFKHLLTFVIMQTGSQFWGVRVLRVAQWGGSGPGSQVGQGCIVRGLTGPRVLSQLTHGAAGRRPPFFTGASS